MFKMLVTNIKTQYYGLVLAIMLFLIEGIFMFTPLRVIAANNCDLYIDVKLEENLLFSRYDVDVYLDGEMIATASQGKYATKLVEVKSGKHTLSFMKAGEKVVLAEKTESIDADSTFKCTIKTKNNKIKISNWDVVNGCAGASIQLMDLTGLRLDEALSKLKDVGFVNFEYLTSSGQSASTKTDWTVVNQNLIANRTYDKNEYIKLTLQDTQTYFADTFKTQNYNEVNAKVNALGYAASYEKNTNGKIMNDELGKLSLDEKKLWQITSVKVNDKINKTVVFKVRYIGKVVMPDLLYTDACKCKDQLESLNFSIVELIDDKTNKTIDVVEEYIVTSQNVSSGRKIAAHTKLEIKCTKSIDYFSDYLKDVDLVDVDEELAKIGYKAKIINVIDKSAIKDIQIDDETRTSAFIFDSIESVSTQKKLVEINAKYIGTVIVPNVCGMSITEAKKELQEMNFSNIKVDSFSGAKIGESDEGIIMDQLISQGIEVNADEEIIIIAYMVNKINTTMYATGNVNVRELPNATGNKVGQLENGQEVIVTGKCTDTGWMRIWYEGYERYVSDEYLSATQ